MAFKQTELDEIAPKLKAFISNESPPAQTGAQLAFCIDRQSVVLLEVRPDLQALMSGEGVKLNESPIAKATWVRSRQVWRVFWMPADGNWEAYVATPEVDTVDEFLDVLKEDELACFFG